MSLRVNLLQVFRWLHALDYAYLLPAISKLPLNLGFQLSNIRGKVNSLLARDWRSIALGKRHIEQQSILAYALLPGIVSGEPQKLTKQRFETESREEFEAWLVVRKRLNELSCIPTHPAELGTSQNNGQGLVLLTLHLDSFFLGAGFLARNGRPINFMASAITHDSRVDIAVQNHFAVKYRSLEDYLNGGKIVNMEGGMRPFYRMLERNQTLIVLGDSPPLTPEPSDSDMVVNFLGEKRRLAGGALRLAQATHSNIGAYLCYYCGPGQYRVEVCPPGPALQPQTIQNIYDFFSQAILKDPGRWWGADLLPNMPIVELTQPGQSTT